MTRLFLRLYGVLIATLALSFVVQMQLMEYVWKHVSAGFDCRHRFHPTFYLVEETLRPLPREAWPTRLAELSGRFQLGMRLEPVAAPADRGQFKAGQAQALADGAIISVDRPGGGFRLLKRIGASDSAAAIDFPGPDHRKTRLLTYAVNWAVEFAIVAVLVFFWVRPFWRDLTSLGKAAESVGAGRFDAPARVGRFSALRHLARAFEAMARRVDALLQSHRALTSAVSHELRTPLARLRFSHSLAREEPSAEGKDRLLARMERDIAEIDELTTELLDYARIERGATLVTQTVPAGPWLEDVVADAPPPGGRAVRILSHVEAATLRCEPRYMARAVANLLRNALRHAQSSVAVTVLRQGARTYIHVDDDGCGIPSAERERLFEPFARLDRSRDRHSGGFGLGLAIVRQVARWHGGDAELTESPLGGTRATISW